VPISVSIIEDHQETRESIAQLLRRTPGLTLMGIYPTAEAALADLPQEPPDVVLVDIRLPGMSGIECVGQLKSRVRKLCVLMLTTYEERELIFDSLRAGASGYLLKKNASCNELIQAIEQVHAGGAPMSMPIARKLVSYFQNNHQPSEMENLTQREQEILTLLARGHQYKQIADDVGISLDTVRTHIKHIYDKLHVQSRTEATVKFLGTPR
jgi:DNA-binding NarL/FixJ family response regulator